MNAGAVMLTDSVFWFIIVPFLTIKDYNLSFMNVNLHSFNAILLLGDTALNCLQVPAFRITFFILWTGAFVIFQWIIHACVSFWWPYPFLDLSSPYAPVWYLLVAVMHIPCYGSFVLIVKMKRYLLTKWFPLSCALDFDGYKITLEYGNLKVVRGRENWVCKLSKSLYGLKQSLRQWFEHFESFIKEKKYTPDQFDHYVYFQKPQDGGPFYWRSTLQSTVALSTIQAEYMVVIEVFKEVIWLLKLTKELGIFQKNMEIFCDSKSAIFWQITKSIMAAKAHRCSIAFFS
uniref:Reverse transcriptase Ty1/copia-type domain-containing protein n=1 Tax=Cannabis sativa TaxID=3483 RepID=A0A803QJ03_CANSA